MKVFVTGASGGLGSVLIPKLAAAGHTVTGLARSSSSIQKVESLAPGVKAIQGDITHLDVCASAAREADIVIHLAFDHQQAFSGDFVGACKKDKEVIKAICDAMTKSTTNNDNQGKLFMLASGTLGLSGPLESDEPHRSPHMPRPESTDLAFSYVPTGLHVIQLRIAPVTYNDERPHDFIGMQVAEAKKSGHVAYTDSHVWPACSYDNCADCIVLALQHKDKLENPVSLHSVAEEGVPHKDVAEVLASKLGLPSKRIEDAELGQLGFLGMLMSIANPAKSDKTRQLVGWDPRGDGLLAQLKRWSY